MKIVLSSASLLLSIIASALPLHAYADTEEDGRLWLNLTMEGTLSQEHKLGWYVELQPRWKEELNHFDQYLIRPAINYKLSDRASIWLGYADVRTNLAKGTSHEQRWWQQFMYTFPTFDNGITLTSRTRLEQRNLDTGDDTGYRVRQLLRASKKLESNADLSLLLWNELFVNTNNTDWGARSGFDQNRAFAGIAWQAQANARLEVGYINQFIRGQNSDRMNHILSTSLFIRF
ncbi:DUF2490 domain-containing protein [Methylobacillus gramineus]|uniref:DUF2490 domain-containing protein n=1 Tax=Methylobacillus gramineus TaxID=755169 RepID=UPI001CFF7DBC|nr:DUF2490 domain-containing protein [Methylobacillus gramineus]MCB5183926.1 DUF2490 domain-containing protein [Methylobacillus gramineus]